MLFTWEPVFLAPTWRIREAPKVWRTNLTTDISSRVLALRNMDRGLRWWELQRINAHLRIQLELLASIPERVERLLDTNPDTPIEEVLNYVLPKRNKLSNAQRERVRQWVAIYMKRRIHIRIRRVFERIAKFWENNQLEWFHEEVPNLKRWNHNSENIIGETWTGFYFFGKYRLLWGVEFIFDSDYVTCYFSNPIDYYRAYGHECGTDKGKPSAGAVIWKSVSIINSPAWKTQGYVKPHEDQHIRNGYILAEIDATIEARIKDEIIAYMTDTSLTGERIIAILCKEWWLYHYDDISDWEAHKKMVGRYVETAFQIKKLFPEHFINLLAVTEVRLWRRFSRI